MKRPSKELKNVETKAKKKQKKTKLLRSKGTTIGKEDGRE